MSGNYRILRIFQRQADGWVLIRPNSSGESHKDEILWFNWYQKSLRHIQGHRAFLHYLTSIPLCGIYKDTANTRIWYALNNFNVTLKSWLWFDISKKYFHFLYYQKTDVRSLSQLKCLTILRNANKILAGVGVAFGRVDSDSGLCKTHVLYRWRLSWIHCNGIFLAYFQ